MNSLLLIQAIRPLSQKFLTKLLTTAPIELSLMFTETERFPLKLNYKESLFRPAKGIQRFLWNWGGPVQIYYEVGANTFIQAWA